MLDLVFLWVIGLVWLFFGGIAGNYVLHSVKDDSRKKNEWEEW
jgi:hypothetical protein